MGAKLGLHGKMDAHPYTIDPSGVAALAERADGELARLFFAHEGRQVHKWTHYFQHYERHFAPYRGTPVKMLEIGVFRGGSLELWRKYFGPEAVLYGVDIEPGCADLVSPPNQVRIGSQDDPAFLRSVVAEMGGLDIVLDDGSHIGRHQTASFAALFPLLRDGGLYVIEDLHSSYWPGALEGGYRRPGTAIELVKTLIDDMHARFHRKGVRSAGQIVGIHIYDSIVFIEKGPAATAGHVGVPQARR
ncbi:MAG TPA: class I SAM-dependent methyltransferase [Allosphingosinicella sp.]